MRILRIVVCGLVISSFALSNCVAQSSNPFADFDAYAAAALVDLKTPGMAVAVVKEGKVVFARGYGVQRFGRQDAVDERTIFPIASVTKVFTATWLAQLVEEGKLKWDDRVVAHLPEFVLHDSYLTQEVRIADLVTHRTGLETADLLAFRGDYDRAEILRRLRYVQPVTPFRSRYGYNNLMIVTAGVIGERVSGEQWASGIKKRILEPLGMTSTFTSPRELEGKGNVSTPHVMTDGQIVPDPSWSRDATAEGFRRLHDAVAPAGAMQSNVLDMARFVQLYLAEGDLEGKRLLQATTIREMFAPHSTYPIKATPKPNYAFPRFFFGGGYGWQLRDWRGRKVVYHGGSSGAVAAMMPEENIGLVVLANRGSGVVYMVMHDLFDRLLGIPRDMTNQDWVNEAEITPRNDKQTKDARLEEARAKDTKPSLPLDRYTGSYECDLYGRLEIREVAGELKLQFGPNISTTLRHWERDTFRGKLSFPPDDEWFVRFVISDSQPNQVEVERIYWHEPMPPFRRVAAPAP